MNHNKRNIISALVFSILSIIGYLITYNNKILFFLVFLCERLYSFGAKEELEKSLNDLELEDGKKGKNTLGVIIALILGIIGISVYTILLFVVIFSFESENLIFPPSIETGTNVLSETIVAVLLELAIKSSPRLVPELFSSLTIPKE